jgi:hypothetical protein
VVGLEGGDLRILGGGRLSVLELGPAEALAEPVLDTGDGEGEQVVEGGERPGWAWTVSEASGSAVSAVRRGAKPPAWSKWRWVTNRWRTLVRAMPAACSWRSSTVPLEASKSMVSPSASGTARHVCARSSLSGSPVPRKITRPMPPPSSFHRLRRRERS